VLAAKFGLPEVFGAHYAEVRVRVRRNGEPSMRSWRWTKPGDANHRAARGRLAGSEHHWRGARALAGWLDRMTRR